MSRTKFDDAARINLTDCVKQIETKTDAELVLIVRARSGSYRAADYLFATLLAFATLLFLIFAPINFHEYWAPIDVALIFAIGAFVSSRSNIIRRLFTTEAFRRGLVRTGAAAMFYEAGIANTHAEMGVLIYVSILERQLELIADRGVLQGVNALAWNQALSNLREAGRLPQPQTLQIALEKLGELLAKHLPATGDNPNELPDAPRFELK